jgi:hypothetical protein
MAKTIITRIKNKVDTLAAWQAYTGTLLNGEIAVVRVPTGETYTNPVTGASEPVVELLMKVGDGTTTFANLPWMSAKASDVYDWAKAAKVEFNSTDNKIYFKQANGTNITSIDLSPINAKIAALESGKLSDITVTPNGTTGVVKNVEKDGTGKIKVTRATIATGDIADSAVTAAKIANSNVTTAKIADGAITSAKLGTDISSDKINVGTSTTDGTLSRKLSTMEAAIAANTSKPAGHTDAAINTLIDNKINNLDGGEDSGSSGSDKYVSKVVQTNGKVATTYTSFPTAGTSTAGLVKLGASGGAATYDVVNTLSTQVDTNKADIANLKSAVAGGVHFRGTVSAAPSASTTEVNNVTITAGDVVIYDGKEYICTAVTSGAPSWEQLGDVTRIGNLETKINNLDYSTVTDGAATNSKFVTKVTQTDGKIAATYARPTTSDISYGSSSDVKTKLENIDAAIAAKASSADVYTKTQTDSAITTALGNLDFTSPSASNTTTSFIDTVSQTNGQVSATKKTITSASTSAKGIVQLNDTVTSTSTTLAATANAVKTAYDKAAEAAADAASRATGTHGHGNIGNDGTLAAANVVVVTDANKKIVASTTITTTELAQLDGINTNETIQAQLNKKGTSNLTLGTTSTTAAAGNHKHDSDYASKTDFAAVSANYVKFNSADNKLYIGANGTDEIIFDCGGAE